MGFEAKPWLLWWAVAASAAVHVGAAAGFGALAHALPRGPTDSLSEVEIVVLESAPLEDPADPEEPRDEVPRLQPLPADPPPTGARPDGRDRLASLDPSIVPPSVVQLPEVTEPSDDPEEAPTQTDPEATAPEVMVALDPTSVAAAMVFANPPPTIPRDGAPGAPVGDEARDQALEQALESALDGALASAANARPYVSRRGPPPLRERPDGSYEFEGHAFGARIAPDGTVSFTDRPGVDLDTPSLTRANGLVPSGSFDLADAFSRARGQDPYRHERAWFMRETEVLRDRLADAADAVDQRRGMGRMSGNLRRIWAGRGTSEAKRQRIFAIWDDCTEDEIGVRARAAIVDFVRRSLRVGTPDAYTAAELSRLNSARVSREPFAPY